MIDKENSFIEIFILIYKNNLLYLYNISNINTSNESNDNFFIYRCHMYYDM